jgi:hypothetical protein
MMDATQANDVVWARIVADAPEHYASLLAAHELLVAVADVCSQATGVLESCHASTHPLLVRGTIACRAVHQKD